MKLKDLRLDLYTRRARLKPATITALPIGLTILAIFPDILASWGIVWSLIVWSGGTLLIAQVGRDFGAKKEVKLFKLWGGKPTTKMLRHRDAQNKITLQRWHIKLMALIPGTKIPTTQEEQTDSSAADEVYESCVTFLRGITRDKEKFPLIFEENCNYGFRRNLWGMKPFGILLSASSIVTITTLVLASYFQKGLLMPIVMICGLVNILLFLGWLLLFKPDWVKIAAEAYAERLLESIDQL